MTTVWSPGNRERKTAHTHGRAPIVAALIGGALLAPTNAYAANVHAATEASARTSAAAPSPAEQAQALFKQGAAQYELSNYQAAVEKFSECLVFSLEIEDDALRTRVLHALQFNLARAHVKTYDMDGDAQHLRIAVDLLGKHLAKADDLGAELEAEALLARARALLDDDRSPQAAATTDETATATNTQAAPPAPSAAQDDPPNTADRPPKTPGKSLVLAGYGALAGAAVGFGVMAGGLVMANAAQQDREEAVNTDLLDAADRKGGTGNAMFYGGLAGGVVLAGVGAALIAVGKKKSRSNAVSLAPWWHAGGAGLHLRGAF